MGRVAKQRDTSFYIILRMQGVQRKQAARSSDGECAKHTVRCVAKRRAKLVVSGRHCPLRLFLVCGPDH